jgi:hypothetical protein
MPRFIIFSGLQYRDESPEGSLGWTAPYPSQFHTTSVRPAVVNEPLTDNFVNHRQILKQRFAFLCEQTLSSFMGLNFGIA